MAIDCLLVFPYFLNSDPTQRKKRSPFPPLGLLYVGAALRNAGFSVKLLDCTFLKSREEAAAQIRKERPKVVGIHSMITLTRNALALAEAAKETGSIVVFGGPDASVSPEKYLRYTSVDFVVVGEGERTAPELLECIRAGTTAESVNGLAYRDSNGQIVRNQPRELMKNLDGAPLPMRELLDNDAYIRAWQQDHGYALTSIMTTRGCPYGCFFCSEKLVYGRRYTVRTPGNVLDELEEVVNKFGYDRVWFADDIFPLSKSRTLQICNQIVGRGLNFTWSCLARADLVDEQVMAAMGKAGCEMVFYGVESGSQEILDAMNRDMTVNQIRRGMTAAKQAGIRVHAFMMMGFPGESYQTIQATIRFMKEINPDEFSFTVAYPLPGTELFHMVDPLGDQLEWENPGDNALLFKSNIPEWALRFAIWKTKYEFYAHKRIQRGQQLFGLALSAFKSVTDIVLFVIVPKQAMVPKLSKCEVMAVVTANLPRA